MTKAHLKSTVAPKSWTLLRKEHKFVVRPNPGPHPARLNMPITMLIRNLGYAKTTREIKKMLNAHEILVDQRRVKDHRYPIGFMDVVSIKSIKSNFRIGLNANGRLSIVPIADEAQASLKICRIQGKRIISKGKNQLNLSGGRNVLAEKGNYKVGDSFLVELPSQKIVQHIGLEQGALIFITGGKNMGRKGVVDGIEGNKVFYALDGEKSHTLKKYTFVIGKDKELLQLN